MSAATDSLIVEYIWTDADGITFRSKTRMFYGEQAMAMDTDPKDYPEWSYDGSSTGDITNYGEPGCQTECKLIPYFVYTAPECHTVDRYVLCMSKEIRDCEFCERCNSVAECVCLDSPDFEPPCKECDVDNYRTATAEEEPENGAEEPENGADEPDNGAEEEPDEEPEEELDDETIEEYLNAEDDDIGALYEDDSRPNWPDKDFENHTSYARQTSDEAIEMLQVHPKIWKHRPMIGFEQEFFIINPETGYPVGFVQSACPFTRALSHLGLRPRYTPVSGQQGPYYCSNGFPIAQVREMMDEVLLTAREMEIGIAGFNYEVAPGQAEFQVFGDMWESCNDLVMLRFLLVRTAEKYGLKIDFRPVVVRGQNINNSGCHVNFSTAKMRAKGGLDYIFAFLEYLSDTAEAFPHKYYFEQIYGQGVCERLTGRLETSNWMDFSWDIGTRDTSIRIPISVNEAKCGYFEDRRPGANVNPYVIAYHMFERIMGFESLVYAANIERYNRARAAKEAKLATVSGTQDSESEDTNQQEEEFEPEQTDDEPPKSIAGKVLFVLGF